MSTEARAPREDVERADWYLDRLEMASGGNRHGSMVLVSHQLLTTSTRGLRATLRDLSRKLEEAEADREKWWMEAADALTRAEEAEAALEEEREPDAWVIGPKGWPQDHAFADTYLCRGNRHPVIADDCEALPVYFGAPTPVTIALEEARRERQKAMRALHKAAVREGATLETLVKAGEALVVEEYDEAYHLLYWLLVDHYGMSQLPGGPFASALCALSPQPQEES